MAALAAGLGGVEPGVGAGPVQPVGPCVLGPVRVAPGSSAAVAFESVPPVAGSLAGPLDAALEGAAFDDRPFDTGLPAAGVVPFAAFD